MLGLRLALPILICNFFALILLLDRSLTQSPGIMNNEEEKRCPLCAEEMDWTDQQLNPCKCGYEVCVWCWHHIMDMAEKDATEGRCPACRTPYDKDRIVGLESNFQRVTTSSSNRKQKLPKPKPKPNEVRKDLSNVRVIQRKMAYIIGLPLDLADEDLLQRKAYFGQYGKVTKVSLSRTAGGALQQFTNDTCSVYITFSKEEEAVTCIQSVHGYVLDGMLLRASFGTAKYCHAWLRNMPCNNPGCLYLHTIGAEEDSFGKDEVAAVHTRNRVQEIVGGTQYPHRRSGSMLPPPVIDQSSKSDLKVASSDQLPCSKEKDEAIKSSTNMATFVDIVGRGSSNSSSVKDVNSVEEEEEEDKSDSYVDEEEVLELNDGYNEMKFQNLAKSDRIYRGSNSFSNEEIVEHLRRLDHDILVNNDENSADVENSIISDILSIDLDGCDSSVAGLFEARDGRHHSDQSRFSFANQHSDIGFRAQNLTPPGFSMPSKPPPGFSSMRSDQAVAASSGSYFGSRPKNDYRTPSSGNLSNSSDDVIDPAMMLGGGVKPLANRLTNSWPSSSFSSPCSTSFDDDTNNWHFMPPQVQTPTIQQPHQIIPQLFPSPPSLFTQQQYSQPKFGNGYQQEPQQRERETFLPNYGEYMFQMPNSGDVYTRVFGM
ncbi:hypothetical protein L1887_16510 [Cichorium endivia]|nr:hypothetical protein L1887_16510 [Cichorium endivia]